MQEDSLLNELQGSTRASYQFACAVEKSFPHIGVVQDMETRMLGLVGYDLPESLLVFLLQANLIVVVLLALEDEEEEC